MKRKKLKLNKDTLLILENGMLDEVGGGIVVSKTKASCGCTATGCTCDGCASIQVCPTNNCTLGCPTTPQTLP